MKISISPISVRCVLCPRKVRAAPSTVYLPMRGPRLSSTPSVNAPATPWTTSDAIESWKPKRVVSQPPELQPQAASMIQTTEPSSDRQDQVRGQPDALDERARHDRRGRPREEEEGEEEDAR